MGGSKSKLVIPHGCGDWRHARTRQSECSRLVEILQPDSFSEFRIRGLVSRSNLPLEMASWWTSSMKTRYLREAAPALSLRIGRTRSRRMSSYRSCAGRRAGSRPHPPRWQQRSGSPSMSVPIVFSAAGRIPCTPLRASDDFDVHWEFHETQECNRNYASQYADHHIPEIGRRLGGVGRPIFHSWTTLPPLSAWQRHYTLAGC
jgi:hypothetical protein